MSVFRDNLPRMRLTSPAVVRILHHIGRRYRIRRDPDIGGKIREVQYEGEIPGSGNLWGRLAMSDLPRRLASRALLPDVYEAMPGYAASWYGMFRPKSLEQQVDQVIEHLDWFLTPSQYAPSIYTLRLTLQILLISMIVGIVFSIGAMIAVLHYGIPIEQYFGLFLGLAFFIWRLLGCRTMHGLTIRISRNKRQLLIERNATVLYHYLLREFSEPVEEDHAD